MSNYGAVESERDITRRALALIVSFETVNGSVRIIPRKLLKCGEDTYHIPDGQIFHLARVKTARCSRSLDIRKCQEEECIVESEDVSCKLGRVEHQH